MAVKIGSARIDENGHARGGKIGDQTGKEVSTQNWYKHSKGWVVIRPKGAFEAERIAQAMAAACKNNNIGYDQGNRLSLWNKAKPKGFFPGLVDEKCETDCSALVRVCCAYAGIIVGNFTTANEKAILKATGDFDILTDAKYTDSSVYLLRGDILCTKTQGHTVVVLSNGSKAKPRTPQPAAREVRVTGGSVNVRTGPGTDHAVLGVVHKGDVLPLRGEMENGWYPVTYRNEDGWISGKYAEVV